MRNTFRLGPIKSLAIALALVGAMLFGAPRGAEAAPVIVSAEVAGPASGITEVQYRGHHFDHHRGRHWGHHHRGRHFGHHRHRHHFGHHHGRRHGHHHGHRRYRY